MHKTATSRSGMKRVLVEAVIFVSMEIWVLMVPSQMLFTSDCCPDSLDLSVGIDFSIGIPAGITVSQFAWRERSARVPDILRLHASVSWTSRSSSTVPHLLGKISIVHARLSLPKLLRKGRIHRRGAPVLAMPRSQASYPTDLSRSVLGRLLVFVEDCRIFFENAGTHR